MCLIETGELNSPMGCVSGCRENKGVILEFDDWLDGIHKTAVNSVQNKEIKGGETTLSYHHTFLPENRISLLLSWE